ncbi:MAG: hypothetical protein LBT67_02745 [Holosporaceae bacterium]|nr:hypothetical protein [Holosporaceae bacterium]
MIDLVEIKLSAILVQDKDDIREVRKLKHCRNELLMSRKFYAKGISNKTDKGMLSTIA